MKRLMYTLFSASGFILATALLFTSFSKGEKTIITEDSSTEATNAEYDLPQVIKSIPTIGSPSFAGEPMPLNIDTRERLDREMSVNSYWHSSTLLNIKMGQKYFPIIEPILAEEGVPDDFKFLAVAESNLRNVQSSARAKGFWQFRKLAAKELGLEVNDEVDERYHVEKATRAAAKYLKKLKNRFGSWTNAAAAYNVGPTNYSRSMKSQLSDSFYDLNLNQETNRYVFRLIAIKEIMSNPQAFGFYINPGEYYESIQNVYYVDVNASVSSWAQWAKDHGTTYRLLKYYNPWLRDSKLTVKKNRYKIKLPRV